MTPEQLKQNKIGVICTTRQQANKLAQTWRPGYCGGNWGVGTTKPFSVAWCNNEPGWMPDKGEFLIRNNYVVKMIDFSEVNFNEGLKINYLIL